MKELGLPKPEIVGPHERISYDPPIGQLDFETIDKPHDTPKEETIYLYTLLKKQWGLNQQSVFKELPVGEVWSEQKILKAVLLALNGFNTVEIAKKIGSTPGSIKTMQARFVRDAVVKLAHESRTKWTRWYSLLQPREGHDKEALEAIETAINTHIRTTHGEESVLPRWKLFNYQRILEGTHAKHLPSPHQEDGTRFVLLVLRMRIVDRMSAEEVSNKLGLSKKLILEIPSRYLSEEARDELEDMGILKARGEGRPTGKRSERVTEDMKREYALRLALPDVFPSTIEKEHAGTLHLFEGIRAWAYAVLKEKEQDPLWQPHLENLRKYPLAAFLAYYHPSISFEDAIKKAQAVRARKVTNRRA